MYSNKKVIELYWIPTLTSSEITLAFKTINQVKRRQRSQLRCNVLRVLIIRSRCSENNNNRAAGLTQFDSLYVSFMFEFQQRLHSACTACIMHYTIG